MPPPMTKQSGSSTSCRLAMAGQPVRWRGRSAPGPSVAAARRQRRTARRVEAFGRRPSRQAAAPPRFERCRRRETSRRMSPKAAAAGPERHRDDAAADPGRDVRKIMSAPWPAPNRYSPQAAAWASLAAATGTPRRAQARVPAGNRRNGQGGGIERVPGTIGETARDGNAGASVPTMPVCYQFGDIVEPDPGVSLPWRRVVGSSSDLPPQRARRRSWCRRGRSQGWDRCHAAGPRRCRATASTNQPVICSGRVIAEPTTTAHAPASRAARTSGVR